MTTYRYRYDDVLLPAVTERETGVFPRLVTDTERWVTGEADNTVWRMEPILEKIVLRFRIKSTTFSGSHTPPGRQAKIS
jgi:hypothetical protein